MSAASDVRAFRRRATAVSAALALVRGALRAVPVLAAALAASAVADRLFVLPGAAREALWALSVALGAAALVSGFWPTSLFRPGPQARALSARAAGRTSLREDDLRLALELENDRSGGSAALRDAFVDSVRDRLAAASPAWCFPPQPWARLAGAAAGSALVVALLAALVPGLSASVGRVIDPFVSLAVESGVRIAPGDARVPEGGDVDVRLEPVDPAAAEPDLLIRTDAGWDTAVAETDGAARVYHLRNILQPVVYRVRWRGETSRRFTLTPVVRARIAAVSVKITPPSYTGKAPAVQSSPEVSALAGSEAEVTADASLDLASAVILFSDGREKPVEMTGPRRLRATFLVAADGTYHFRLTDKSGNVTETETYPIAAAPDRPPEIELLSPTEGLAIGEREKLPLTFQARDDVALAEIRIEWESPRGKNEMSAIRYRDRKEGGIQSYNWDLAASGLKSGDHVRYRLAAVDANTVTGPGIGRTPWMDLEIASFDREHEAIEQALEAWRDKSVDLLAQVNSLKSRADKGAESADKMSADFNNTAQLSSQLEQAMSAIVNKMENDPLADYGVWTEHQAIADSYKAMNRSLVPQARGALQTGNKAAASQTLDEMSSEIERMTSLSEDLTKRQHARDALERGDKLEKLGQDLMDKLQNANAKDPQLMSAVQSLLNEAAKNLQELARSLQQMPNELPEDFVNQQALKSIKIGSAQDMLQKIADAMKAGDMAGAMKMAQDFLKMTQDIRKKVSEAHESYASGGSMSELQKKIEEEAKKLNDAVDKQRSVFAGTQALESKRLERALKEQNDAFVRLADRQRAAIALLQQTMSSLGSAPLGSAISSQMPPMIQVYQELQAKKIEKSFDVLPSVVTQFRNAEQLAVSSAAVAAPSLRKLGDEESAILDELKALRDKKPDVPSTEKPDYDSLKTSQDALAKSTQELRQQFQALSRKTASLGLPLTESLNRASAEMKGAGDSLGATDSRTALGHEQTALSSLLEAQSTLQQAQDAMSAMSSGSAGGGAGGGPRIIARPMGAAAQKGMRPSPVKFPTADDYRPPREFREDLLESLKENYPKVYEDIIHRYYRRLAD